MINETTTSESQKKGKTSTRLILKLTNDEHQRLENITSGLKENGENISRSAIMKYFLNSSEPANIVKKIIKSKKAAEEILRKAEVEAQRLWTQ